MKKLLFIALVANVLIVMAGCYTLSPIGCPDVNGVEAFDTRPLGITLSATPDKVDCAYPTTGLQFQCPDYTGWSTGGSIGLSSNDEIYGIVCRWSREKE